MPDQKLSQLPALNVISPDDLLYVVDSPAGTPVGKRIRADDLGIAYPAKPADGRLTLTSGTPITNTDVVGASTLFYTPSDAGNRIALWDYGNGRWKIYQFSELTVSLAGCTAGLNYDVFVYNNLGTLALEITAWANNSARATALTRQHGILVKGGDPTVRYVGTIRASASGVGEDSVTKRFVWNMYNRALRDFVKTTVAAHSYTSASWRSWNNDTANRVEFVCGDVADIHVINIQDLYGGAMATVALDSTSVENTVLAAKNANASSIRTSTAKRIQAGAGYHYLQSIEFGSGGANFEVMSIGGGIHG